MNFKTQVSSRTYPEYGQAAEPLEARDALAQGCRVDETSTPSLGWEG